MKSAVISNCILIREGLSSIIAGHNNMKINLSAETLKEAVPLIEKEEIDIVLLHLYEHSEDELMLIKAMKERDVSTRFIIVDFTGNKELFVKAIKCGVEGYILGKSNETEILHIIDQIHRGKKYYDAYFIDSMINENNVKAETIEQLTPREKEILCEVGKGMNNHAISEKLYISENTVKKHINHIFEKLHIADRTQAALYANKCGLISITKNTVYIFLSLYLCS